MTCEKVGDIILELERKMDKKDIIGIQNLFDKDGNFNIKIATELMKNTPKEEQDDLWGVYISLAKSQQQPSKKNEEEAIIKEEEKLFMPANPKCFDTATFSPKDKPANMSMEVYMQTYVDERVFGCHESDNLKK